MSSTYRRYQTHHTYKKHRDGDDSDYLNSQSPRRDSNRVTPPRYVKARSRSPIRRPFSSTSSSKFRSPDRYSIAEIINKKHSPTNYSTNNWYKHNRSYHSRWQPRNHKTNPQDEKPNFIMDVDHRMTRTVKLDESKSSSEEKAGGSNTLSDSKDLTAKVWIDEAENVFRSDCITISEVTQLFINEDESLKEKLLPVMEKCLRRLLSSHLNHLKVIKSKKQQSG
uniref:Uncharacterized LOC100183537 n=1 Tax=Ciona intestinalis TaxID=7719 RepID=H2XUD8_CIOIN|nr:uncharacterized protein LOC100183537 [Ciona intestinalis]|eukprot:XP_002128390.1 uncharacterized protein LOC100183537 [Ciona intestinalis]